MNPRPSVRRLGASLAVVLMALTLDSFALAEDAAGEKLSLTDATRQAIASNLDLLAQRRALAADQEEIGQVRAALLPRVDLGAQAQFLDDDRSDSSRGNNKDESVQVQAMLSQTLYDEESWASFDVQKHTYAGQVEQLQSFELEIIQDAANAFLELERAEKIFEIQLQNREITSDNLDTSHSLVAAGWSGEQDNLRWENQLASNDASVREAQARILQQRFELNRVRNLAPEAATSLLPATIEEYGFVYARDAIAKTLIDPANDRRMRDYLVRVGIRRSPNLAVLDATIAAAKRQLTASRRAFWVPTLTLNAGIDHLANNGSGDDYNETEWGVKGVLSFPLFEGGGKFATRDRSVEILASQRTERMATVRTLSQSIRSAFAQSSATFESVGFAKRQLDAAQRNFDLVDASYTLGVDSILDLLDAQQQLLVGELSVVNATYDFLEDLIAAEREISFYAYLQPPAEVGALLDDLEREIIPEPVPGEATP